MVMRGAWRGLLVATLGLLVAMPGLGWTPGTQVALAEAGAQLAPPDLLRLIARHRQEYRDGVMAAFQDGDALRHVKNADGSGTLDDVILYEVDGAIKAIRAHRPFERVVYRLGVVAHYVADANNPLNTDASDRQEATYFADFARYAESAEGRFETVFYGLRPKIQKGKTLAPMVRETLERSRSLYPLIGREYQRIGEIDGRRHFDDRSTAFGLAAIAHSHAVSDIAETLRFIWLKAGGADRRRGLPLRGQRLVVVPKADPLPVATAGAP